MSLICPGPVTGGGAGGLTLESSATAGSRTASQNTFTRVDTTGAGATITLPASGDSGDRVAVHNEVGTNDVTVQPDTGDNLDGVLNGTQVLRPGETATWYWDGTDSWVRESRGHVDALSLEQGGTGLVLDTGGRTRLYSTANETWRIDQAGSSNNYVGGNLAGDDFRVIRSNANRFAVNQTRIRGSSGGVTDLGELAAPFDACYLNEGGSGLVLDADGDSYILASADDFVDFYTGAVLQFRISSSEVRAVRPLTTVNGAQPSTSGGSDIGSLSLPYGAVYTNQLFLEMTGAGLRFVAINSTRLTLRFNTGNINYEWTTSAFYPDGLKTLGTLANSWDALYITEAGTGIVLDADGDSYILAPSDDVIQFFAGGSEIVRILGGVTGVDGLRPGASNAYDLGATTRYWRNIFIAGDLRPSTTSVELGTSSVGLGAVYMNQGGTGLVLDADGDSYIIASADDQIDIFTGGGIAMRIENQIALPITVYTDLVANANDDLGNGLKPWGDIWADGAIRNTAAGFLDIGFSGTGIGDIYLDGTSRVYFDDDVDTYIHAPSDDVLEIVVGTSSYTAEPGAFRPSGAGSGDDLGADLARWDALYLSQAGQGVVLDSDADTQIRAGSDDQIQFFLGGTLRNQMTNTALEPGSAGVYTLGTASLQWGEVFTDDVVLVNRGTYTTDPVTDGVAPSAPTSGCTLFMVDTSAGVEEFWVRFASGTAKKVTDDT